MCRRFQSASCCSAVAHSEAQLVCSVGARLSCDGVRRNASRPVVALVVRVVLAIVLAVLVLLLVTTVLLLVATCCTQHNLDPLFRTVARGSQGPSRGSLGPLGSVLRRFEEVRGSRRRTRKFEEVGEGRESPRKLERRVLLPSFTTC